MQLPTTVLCLLPPLLVVLGLGLVLVFTPVPSAQRAPVAVPQLSGQSQSQQVPQAGSFDLGGGPMPAYLPPGPSGSISLPSGMTGGSAGGVWPQRKCVNITVPLCRGIGYNHTYMPNEFHQETQEEIAMEVLSFTALQPVCVASSVNYWKQLSWSPSWSTFSWSKFLWKYIFLLSLALEPLFNETSFKRNLFKHISCTWHAWPQHIT